MSNAAPNASVHPPLGTLALYAAGDLSLGDRWRVGRHVRDCASCEEEVHLLRSAKAELRREAQAETLTAYEAIADWGRLEREMLGNIAVGVAAARAIEKQRRGRPLLFKTAAVVGLSALFIAGWVTHIPKSETDYLFGTLRRFMQGNARQPAGTVVASVQGGIVVRAQGATLTILHPPSAVVSMSGPATVSARYVDDETGQVTITNVYGQ